LEGLFGANELKGGFSSYTPALANAIYDAIGVKVKEAP
jgi:CO/xanthine dehydrogenase Mo-binding subunit